MSAGTIYKNLNLEAEGTSAGEGGSPCTPPLRSKFLYRIDEFRPGDKTIWVVFDEESEFSGPRTPKLRPDQVSYEKRTPKF